MIKNHKKEFKEFLLKRKAYKPFCKNIRKARYAKQKLTLDQTFNKYIEDNQKDIKNFNYISCGFMWGDWSMKKSSDFWHKLSLEWKSLIKRLIKNEKMVRK